MKRIAILASHPVQYHIPTYRCLANVTGAQFRVFYCWDYGVRPTFDIGFGREVKWNISLLDGYDCELLPNISPRPGSHHFFGFINHSAVRQILRWKPDSILVHGYNHFTEWSIIATALATRIPLFHRGETHLMQPRSKIKMIMKKAMLGLLFSQLRGALAIGKLSADYYEYYGVPRDRIFVAPYSTDNDYFQNRSFESSFRARTWRAELGIRENARVFVYVAKLIPIKGCDDLIRAFGSLSEQNAELVIIGEGAQRAELEALARSYPQSRIHFLGFVNQAEIPSAYALGDVFVLPSHIEPWGQVVNEAMNLSLPIIASDQVGSAYDLISKENGWIFPSGNIEALRSVLVEALRADIVKMGIASLNRINQWGPKQTAEGFVRALV